MAKKHFQVNKGISLNPQPSAPVDASDGDMYYDSALNSFRKYQSGSWSDVSSGGSSSSGKNFFSDFDCQTIANVTMYDDTTAVPVDGTGGTATGLTATSETTTPLTGTTSYKLSKDAADRLGKGWAVLTNITLDNTVKNGEPITIQFKYQTSANYASGDVKMYIYRVGSNTLEALNGVDGLGNFGNSLNADQTGRGTFTATTSLSSTDTAVRVLFHVASASTSAYDLTVDNVFVGTSTTLSAPSLFSGTAYLSANQTGINPNGSYVKINVNTALHDTNGMFVSGSNRFVFTQNCYTKVTGNITLASTNILASAYGAVLYKNGVAVAFGDVITQAAATLLSLSVEFEGNFVANDYVELYLYGQGNNSASTLTATSGATNTRLSVQGLSAGNTISSTQAMFQTMKMSAYLTSTRSISTTIWQDLVLDTEIEDKFSMYDNSTGVIRVPKSDWYTVHAATKISSTGDQNVFGLRLLNDTDSLDVCNTYETASRASAEPSLQIGKLVYLDSTKNYKIQTYQSTASATDYVAGTAHTYLTINQETDLSVVGISGAPSEYLSATSSVKTPGSSAIYLQMVGNSVTLTPGDWAVDTSCYFSNGGANPGYSYTRILLAGANGNDTGTDPAAITSLSGLTVLGIQDVALDYNTSGDGVSTSRSQTTIYIRLTQTQTLYSVPFVQMLTPSNARVTAYIQARRLK